jgi:hypothetical protein
MPAEGMVMSGKSAPPDDAAPESGPAMFPLLLKPFKRLIWSAPLKTGI